MSGSTIDAAARRRAVRAGQALGLSAWLLAIAWLVLLIADRDRAAGWCLVASAIAAFAGAACFWRTGERSLRVTGVTMALAGALFLVLGLVYAL